MFLQPAIMALGLVALLAGQTPVALAAATPEGVAGTAPRPLPVTAEGLRDLIAESGACATLVNVWATWCIPCRKEMPDLLELRAEQRARGLDLVLVTTDFEASLPEAVEFLTGLKVDFRTYQKKQLDHEFIDGLDPEWSGAIPYSAVFDSQGRLVASFEGRVTRASLDAVVLPLLEDPATTDGDPP